MTLAASAPAWAVWLTLGLWAVAIVLCAVAFVMARRLVREKVMPLLDAFGFLGGGGAVEPAAVIDLELGEDVEA